MTLKTMHYFPASLISGSLPMGGWIPDTPVYAVQNVPIVDVGYNPDGMVKTVLDVDDKVAFYVDHVISEAEANTLIALTEKLGYSSAAPGIQTPPGMRMNKSVHWLDDSGFLSVLFQRLQPFLPVQLDGQALVSMFSQRINMYKYDCSDVFNLHIDGDWPAYHLDEKSQRMVEQRNIWSKLTMLLYLNGHENGIEGGQTRLYRADRTSVMVNPQKGRALFFRHGHSVDSVLHEGVTVTGTTSKYVARINVMYHL
jgi:hypothetical protein